MDQLNQYQKTIQDLLLEHAKTKPAYGDIEVDVSFDTERHHYQIWHTGWLQKRWVHHCPMHFTIRNNKIWLLANSTEHDLAQELVDKGVPKQDIVLGFHPSYMRELSDYAVG
ncbi:XisI protein [Leptolyngbya cf. ectocarpi LEGE 11479]|uniref:XisI protein n=1 Tax=Leptolyngbya cf. ectocarpi LEGE 11479 TaxID=1828722 RepID=A0A929F9I0_LEPEC|nr:XisI protein [Leptolyngbya ectocarpi]MBE9067882.1 XisI protein [Leptolyngbya cf. ectocarpi LEGE 11479]